MFTGLVQAVGTIAAIRPLVPSPGTPNSPVRIELDPGSWAHRPAPGDSIAISGTCLTLVNRPAPGDTWHFDAIPQTLRRTRLGQLRPGDKVNLEHAATLSTLLGGHLVQGHIDAVGTVSRVEAGDDWRVFIQLPEAPDLSPYILDKGSICVDGVSLTVAGLWRERPDANGQGADPPRPIHGFFVALIPTTLELTTLDALEPGNEVNLEVDAAVKAIVETTRAFLDAQLPAAIARELARLGTAQTTAPDDAGPKKS